MVKELKKNEIVNVILGAFDFEFLDTAGRRFDLYLDENNKKRVTHTLFGANGPRPYNIYHLKLLEKLEAIILRQKEKSDLTDTRLQNIFTLLSTKQNGIKHERAIKQILSMFGGCGLQWTYG